MFHFLHSRAWILGLPLSISYIPPSHQRIIEARQSDSLQWGPCARPLIWGEESSLVCANFTAPLDWTNTSNGQNAVLYVAKLKARSGNSLGTIFVNPGGPGGPGFEFLRDLSSQQLSNITGGNFDLVSWDPRGVGLTTPAIDCFDARGNQTADEVAMGFQQYLLENTLKARSNGPDQADINNFLGNATSLENYMQTFIQRCVEKNQDNLKFVGTVATVKDLVALVDAIEGPGSPIRYWGLSYGTVIGSTLMDLYPTRVGRVVLDGILDATLFSRTPSYQSFAESSKDAEKALQAFYDACAAAGPSSCPIATTNSSGASIRQWANNLIDTAYVGGGPAVASITPTLIRTQLSTAARTPPRWQQIASTLSVFYRDLHGTPASNSSTTGAQPAGHRKLFALTKRQGPNLTLPFASMTSSLYAIWCGDAADDNNVNTTTVFNELIRVTKDVAHVDGPLGLGLPNSFCHIWKARSVERHYSQESPRLANPVLIIGNTYDVITPLDSARKLVKRLNDVGTRQAALIQNDGSGHLSLQMNSVCTYTIIQRYFTDGVFPEDTLCGTNFDGFPGDPTTGNHNTATGIISAPLSSASSVLQASSNQALARAPLTIFHIFLLSVIGIFSGLSITL
ncbi:hypothetical protein FRC02_011940 [Tulasnella sp. 418]|nr:hypothetical protein FRC02_011940 [Tulasnella sp. 418]